MKPDPAPEPDENPSSQGPDSNEEKITKEPGEADLWEFEDEPETKPEKPSKGKKPPVSLGENEKRPDDEATPTSIPVSPRGPRRDNLPFKQKRKEKKAVVPGETSAADEAALKFPEPEPAPPPAAAVRSPKTDAPRRVDDAFADLEENPEKPAAEPVGSEKTPEESGEILSGRPDSAEALAAKSAVEKLIEDSAAKRAATPAPASLPALPALSKLERIGLISFLVLIVSVAIFYLGQSLHKLPEKKDSLTKGDFPIKGKFLEAEKFTSYWRPPGAGDTVRRGTALLPVVEIDASGGPGALRVFFRNSTGETIGDAITRPVNGGGKLTFTATAGFDDVGMHAAYRAGDTKPWIVEIREGPSADAPGDAFKMLFEIPLSTELR